MKQIFRTSSIAVAAIMVMAMVSAAQDPEPPFTWKGNGTSWYIGRDGVNEIDYTLKLTIDEAGAVKGSAMTDDWSAKVERLYYSAAETHSFGDGENLSTRKATMVLSFDSDSGDTMLVIMVGRIIADRMFYGETFMLRTERGGEIAKGLQLGSKEAVEVYGDYVPQGLKKAIAKGIPTGCFKVVGSYTN